MPPNVVDGEDVRVVERRRRPRLALEAHQSVGVGGDVRGQHLDRDVATQPLIPGPVDLAHPTRAEQSDETVRAKHRAWGKGQRITLRLLSC